MSWNIYIFKFFKWRFPVGRNKQNLFLLNTIEIKDQHFMRLKLEESWISTKTNLIMCNAKQHFERWRSSSAWRIKWDLISSSIYDSQTEKRANRGREIIENNEENIWKANSQLWFYVLSRALSQQQWDRIFFNQVKLNWFPLRKP